MGRDRDLRELMGGFSTSVHQGAGLNQMRLSHAFRDVHSVTVSLLFYSLSLKMVKEKKSIVSLEESVAFAPGTKVCGRCAVKE